MMPLPTLGPLSRTAALIALSGALTLATGPAPAAAQDAGCIPPWLLSSATPTVGVGVDASGQALELRRATDGAWALILHLPQVELVCVVGHGPRWMVPGAGAGGGEAAAPLPPPPRPVPQPAPQSGAVERGS